MIALPGLNHLFQEAATGAIGEYSTIEQTIAPSVLTLIADWILQVSLVKNQDHPTGKYSRHKNTIADC